MRTGASKRMELPECEQACPSCLAQQPSQRHRDGGEWATALHRKCSGGMGAVERPWDLHGGRGQQPAPESQEENHQHRCLALIRPPAGGSRTSYSVSVFRRAGPCGNPCAMAGCGP